MIIWIASYPKSGNTWLRLFLKSYLNPSNINFFSNPKKNDPFTFESFPIEKNYEVLKIKHQDFAEIAENWINMQSLINLNNKTNYLKTHNAMCTINNYKFTDNDNTLGAIYIVRDPRDVAVSYSSYMNQKINYTIDYMLSPSCYEVGTFKNISYKKSVMGNWSYHYKSWKDYNSKEKIIIRYEDMINKPEETFLKVLYFLNKIDNIKINKQNLKNSINLTSFQNLKKMEINEGFKENPSSKPFFRKGQVGDWKKVLNKDQIKKIEEKFKQEMSELGYL